MFDKAKKCKSKKCKAEKFTAKKAMFGIVMPRNTKLSNAKLKNAGLRMESFSCFIIHGNCILFEFLASFSRCHVVPWQSYTEIASYLNSWHLFRDAMSFRGNTQQMPQESFRAHEAPEDPFVGSES